METTAGAGEAVSRLEDIIPTLLLQVKDSVHGGENICKRKKKHRVQNTETRGWNKLNAGAGEFIAILMETDFRGATISVAIRIILYNNISSATFSRLLTVILPRALRIYVRRPDIIISGIIILYSVYIVPYKVFIAILYRVRTTFPDPVGF